VSTPVEGGRGVGVRLFGFPVHIDLSFVLIMGLIGYISGVSLPWGLVIWLVVAGLAVLLHELGHAVVARTTGARPVIALTGFGGLTTYVPPERPSRLRSLSISIAGPLVGLVVGGLLWIISQTSAAGVEPGGVADQVLRYGMFTTIAWSVLNLLPVLPLDGGQAMRELLPGAPAVRARRAAAVSLVSLVPLVVAAVWWNQPWLMAMMLLFGLMNVMALREPEAGTGQRVAAGGPTLTPEQAVVGLLWQGAPAQARQLLASMPSGTPVDLAVHGAVLATTDQPEQGFALLAQEVARRPGDPNVVALLVLAHALRHDWPTVEAQLGGPLAGDVPLPVVERVLQEASAAGRPDVAARISALPLRGPQPT
jgi:Zn-dependent protease